MQLQPDVLTALNDELTRERFSQALYLALAAEFETLNFSGFAKWARKAAEEEGEHAGRFFDYITDRNAPPVLAALPATPTLPTDIPALFGAALKQEEVVSEALRKLYVLSVSKGDAFTANFLQQPFDFLAEQVGAERELTEIVSKLELVTQDPAGILFMDDKLGGD
jgi:ferritin